jgi:hypothetical protein
MDHQRHWVCRRWNESMFSKVLGSRRARVHQDRWDTSNFGCLHRPKHHIPEKRSANLVVPGRFGPEPALQARIGRRWFIQHALNCLNSVSEDTKYRRSRSTDSASWHPGSSSEIRAIAAKGGRCPINQRLLAPGHPEINVFGAEFARCRRGTHQRPLL